VLLPRGIVGVELTGRSVNVRGRRYRRPRLVVGAAPAALLAVLALAAAGCGGGDDDGDTAAGGQTTAPPAAMSDQPRGDSGGGGEAGGSVPEIAYSGDVEQAREGGASVDDVYEGFAAAVDQGIASTEVAPRDTLKAAAGNESLTRVCDLMSEQAKRQTVVYAKRSAGLADVKWNCENATGLLLRRASQAGGLKKSLRARIVGVNVGGDRATASVRFGGKGPISAIPLVKEDGDWKLAASPSGGGGN
jgi:hypothetical protein